MVYMTDTLARNWWAIALRGLCALLFGAAIFAWPAISLFALVLMFGVYALLDGVCTMVSTVRSDKREKRWWLFLLQGIAGIIVGIMAFSLARDHGFSAAVYHCSLGHRHRYLRARRRRAAA